MSLSFGFFVVRNSIFIYSCFVHWVEPVEEKRESFRVGYRCIFCWLPKNLRVCVPSLVEVNEKHHIVSETGQSVGCWHGDDEGEHIVNKGIERLTTNKRWQSINNYTFLKMHRSLKRMVIGKRQSSPCTWRLSRGGGPQISAVGWRIIDQLNVWKRETVSQIKCEAISERFNSFG